MKQTAANFFSLPDAKRRSALLRLCAESLTVWESHYPPEASISYQETVTGSIQVLDVGLPREALQAAQSGVGDPEIHERYKEPIVALKDNDLEFPEVAEFAYYAIYNAYRLYVIGAKIEEKLILNQALSALPEEEMHQIFIASIAHAA
jgi:hypothetical protein